MPSDPYKLMREFVAPFADVSDECLFDISQIAAEDRQQDTTMMAITQYGASYIRAFRAILIEHDANR